MKYIEIIISIVFIIITTISCVRDGNYIFLFGILSLWTLIEAVHSDIIDKWKDK